MVHFLLCPPFKGQSRGKNHVLKDYLFSNTVPTLAQTKSVIKEKEKRQMHFHDAFWILQRQNLKKSRIFFHPLKFLFVESEIHCFSPYFPCTQSAMGLETAVCIGEYLNLNKNIMATKRKTDSSFPPALMLCKILVTSSPQTKYWVQFDLSHDLPPPGDTF